MSIVVSFFTPKGIGSANAPGVGRVRLRETITVGSTTTGTALEGEWVMIGNNESSMVAAALGSAPNGAATAQTEKTTAGFPIAAGGLSMPLEARAGDKVSVVAV